MTIMSLAAFKTGTHKTFSKRNGAIAHIDTKLSLYWGAQTNPAVLLELQTAINDFKTEKNKKFAATGGTYKNSKREAKGFVTLLSQQVDEKVRASSPSRPVGIPTVAGIAGEVQLRALARQVRAEADFTNVSVPMTQELDYRDSTGRRRFGWTVQLKLIERPTELVVRVALKVNPTKPIVGDFESRWKTHIQSSWNGAILIDGSSGTPRRLPIRFELDWKPVGYAGDAYEVNVHQPPAQPSQEKYGKSASGGWSEQRRGPTVGGRVGTPDMGNWGADDSAAIVHEFGHMIGCPDEYYTVSFNGVPATPDTYDQLPFTTDSVMNNTGPKGRIHARHYHLIKQQYEIWKGLVAGSTSVQVV